MCDQTQIKRCAINTRKSTDEHLDLKFNSLDTQRESYEAYIHSMSGFGWRLVEKHYDDGGFTGVNVHRPALNKLLEDVKAGLVDVVVVYKVDRLSRRALRLRFALQGVRGSPCELRLDHPADRHLDGDGADDAEILMSFSQFEREQSADCVRANLNMATDLANRYF